MLNMYVYVYNSTARIDVFMIGDSEDIGAERLSSWQDQREGIGQRRVSEAQGRLTPEDLSILVFAVTPPLQRG